MSTQTTKSSFVSHQSELIDGEISLPELPLPEELLWASMCQTGLPPTSHMRPEVVIASRLDLMVEISNPTEQHQPKVPITHILESELPGLGLPNLPIEAITSPQVIDKTSGQKLPDGDNCQFELKTESSKFSPSYHYGVDDATLNRVLAATALLIDRMPSQTAVDCLMDMPEWMRNIFLARHGVSSVIGVLLAARLEDSGDVSILASDGTIAAHNKVGPEAVSFAKDLVLPKMDMRSSSLTRLTTSQSRRKNGISIKNPNIVIEQTPRVGRLKVATLI